MSQTSNHEKNSSGEQRSFHVESNVDPEQVLTVSAVTDRIRTLLEKRIGTVWVKGEISNVSFPASGHVYFDLKDEDAKLPVALFRRHAHQVAFDLEDGLEVRVHGKISAYQKRGSYQILAREVRPLGEGALQLAFEQLRADLKEEGLFKAEHKQPLPFLPETIALVTSATGAAVRDMIRTIHGRSPQVRLLIVPVKVQGDEAKHEISRAIKLINERSLADVMILGRGGGSLEDLWPFNEEIVARAIFQSRIPVLSAVGHEVDTTISDLVADHTVPTPTAAGQGVVPERRDLVDKLATRYDRITRLCRRKWKEYQRILENAWTNLSRFHPEKKLERRREQLATRIKSIHRETRRILEASSSTLSALADRLESLNPLDVLKRGYSITRDQKSGDILTSTRSLSEGDRIHTRLDDGSFVANVEEIHES